jgi:DnaJ-class molecular chaperone
MVCAACNGKGYVIENHRESICKECQGRGEFDLRDRDRNYKQEAQQVLEVR